MTRTVLAPKTDFLKSRCNCVKSCSAGQRAESAGMVVTYGTGVTSVCSATIIVVFLHFYLKQRKKTHKNTHFSLFLSCLLCFFYLSGRGGADVLRRCAQMTWVSMTTKQRCFCHRKFPFSFFHAIIHLLFFFFT